MAAIETANRHRDALPSISHLELDKIKVDRPDHLKFGGTNGLSISTALLASPTAYSGPPPPYSYAPSTASTMPPTQGYISPPESTTRRSTRDDDNSPIRKSLPSIHEALGAPLSATVQAPPGSTPSTALTQSFPDAPKGPSNPFSQPAPTFRENPFSSQPTVQPPPPPDHHSRSTHHSILNDTSPSANGQSSYRPAFTSQSSFGHAEQPRSRSPLHSDPSRLFSSHGPSTYTSEPFQFTAGSKHPEDRSGLPHRSEAYGDTVKRHLEVFDAELGLHEIQEASGRTMDFANVWIQRYGSNSRSGYMHEALPSLHEIDDMMRQSNRVMENLAHMREVVIAQQAAASEHRARMARGPQIHDDYDAMNEEYRNGGGYPGADAKKRRGKAAPPGRCHSCNRAETPEWRRGPDGARTLCNACGLHYAKLTRKMGVNKASTLTGSNLRPKNLDQRI